MIGMFRRLRLSLIVWFVIGMSVPLRHALGEQPLGKQDVAMLTLTADDNGRTITGRVDERIAVQLKENPTTGFVWRADPSDGHVAQVATEFMAPSGGFLGTFGTRLFVFRLEKPGEATIRLQLKRNWEGGETAAEYFAVSIKIREMAGP